MSFSLVSTVSVIIPTYNRKHLIQPALDSVLGQTYSNIELIVVDDCSTDGTADWIKQLYPMVRLLSLDENHGAAGARNVGISVAQGDYIAFLDSDDYWSANFLEKAISRLSQEPSSSFVFCDHREITQNTGHEKNICYEEKSQYRDLIHRSLADVFIFTMSVVVARTSAIKKAGPLNEALDICHDRELYIRLLAVGHVLHIPEVLVTRVMHGGNISSDYKNWAKYVFITLDIFFSTPTGRHYKDLEANIRSKWALIIAREVWLQERDFLLYGSMLLKAVMSDPKKMFEKALGRLSSNIF